MVPTAQMDQLTGITIVAFPLTGTLQTPQPPCPDECTENVDTWGLPAFSTLKRSLQSQSSHIPKDICSLGLLYYSQTWRDMRITWKSWQKMLQPHPRFTPLSRGRGWGWNSSFYHFKNLPCSSVAQPSWKPLGYTFKGEKNYSKVTKCEGSVQ